LDKFREGDLMKYTILLAEDDLNIRRLLIDYLHNENYHVIEAIDGRETIDLFNENRQQIDLVILDVMMPHLNGYEVCKKIREDSKVPIIFLTALGDISNELNGFSLGADDFITKPFEYQLLIARIQSVLKRVNKTKNISINNTLINIESHEVSINGTVISLTPKEFELLIYLVNNKNIALARDQILDHIWGYDYYGDERTVDTHIKQLRAKLSDEGQFIKTIRGYGYKLEVR
jgi:two-component system, OmpR family, response regulator ResD